MRRIIQTLSVIAGLYLSAASGTVLAAENPQPLVDRATATMHAMRTDGSFGNAPELLRHAKAVMIVPQLVKGGFIFGAEGGDGVLLRRQGEGWSEPAFFTIAAGSFGLQIGLEEAELVLIVQSERALDAWMKGKFKLGGDVGLTVLVVGANAEAATAGAGADVIAWARTKGAYAGLTLSGAVISPKHKADDAFYHRQLTTRQILFAKPAEHDGASELRHAVEHASEQ
jgi:lipid-binding SYLF domain-containing protein